MSDAHEVLEVLFKVQSEHMQWEPDDPQVGLGCVICGCVCTNNALTLFVSFNKITCSNFVIMFDQNKFRVCKPGAHEKKLTD